MKKGNKGNEAAATAAVAEPTETKPATLEVVELKPEAQVYACSVCGATGTVDEGIVEAAEPELPDFTNTKLWARHKKPGSAVATEVICNDCRAKEIEAAKKAGQEEPRFSPLRSSLERDKQFDETNNRAKDTQTRLLHGMYNEQLRTERSEIVCVRCGHHHGEIMFFKGGSGFRVTLIEHALALNFQADTIILEPLCQDCRHDLMEKAKKTGKVFETYYLVPSMQKAEEINAKRMAARTERAAKKAEEDARDDKFLNRGARSSYRDSGNQGSTIGDRFPKGRR